MGAGVGTGTVRSLPARWTPSGRTACRTFPDECCGALIAVGGVIVDAFALPNTTSRWRGAALPDRPRRLPRLGGARAELKGALAGFYHSHPNHPARPSAHDLEQAWPNFSYVIISVNAAVPGDITCWHLRDDRSAFDQGELICHTES